MQSRTPPIPFRNWEDVICALEKSADAAKEAFPFFSLIGSAYVLGPSKRSPPLLGEDMICALEKAAHAAKEPSHSSPSTGEDMICALEKPADAAKEPSHSSP